MTARGNKLSMMHPTATTAMNYARPSDLTYTIGLHGSTLEVTVLTNANIRHTSSEPIDQLICALDAILEKRSAATTLINTETKIMMLRELEGFGSWHKLACTFAVSVGVEESARDVGNDMYSAYEVCQPSYNWRANKPLSSWPGPDSGIGSRYR